jgi:hypothetical protein
MARWQVELPEVGRIYDGYHAHHAYLQYRQAVWCSLQPGHEWHGRTVLVFRDERIYREHVGNLDREPSP